MSGHMIPWPVAFTLKWNIVWDASRRSRHAVHIYYLLEIRSLFTAWNAIILLYIMLIIVAYLPE